MAAPRARASWLQNGVWSFRPEGTRRTALIHVPSHWTHGACFRYPRAWEAVRRGTYERSLRLPGFAADRLCRVRFEAVMLRCDVFLDDVRIGGHAGGFTPFTCEIPAALWRTHAGDTARLRVEVESAHAAFVAAGVTHMVGYPDASEEGPLPGGIWQSVWLETLPRCHISGWHVRYDHARHEAAFQIELANGTGRRFAGEAVMSGGRRAQRLHLAIPANVAAGGRMVASGRLRLPPALRPWSPRDPRLYELELSLVAAGEEQDCLPIRVGFRSTAVRGRDLLVNGVPTRLFGISLIRHRVAPYLWRRDYLECYFGALRSLGFNALRLHAAIAPDIVLRVADEMGLMLIDQSAIWSTLVGGYTAAGQSFLENTKREFGEWVRRDRNHPAVVAWDV